MKILLVGVLLALCSHNTKVLADSFAYGPRPNSINPSYHEGRRERTISSSIGLVSITTYQTLSNEWPDQMGVRFRVPKGMTPN
jgi:hypothetical protein